MENCSGVTYALGFTATGVACGIKKNGKSDLAVVKCDKVANAAGIFTKNIVKGHSLRLAQKNLEEGRAQLALINSGNANACLSKRGDKDALYMASLAADRFGCLPQHVLTGSTGVIGMPLPMRLIKAGIRLAEPSRDGGLSAAMAIITTDTMPKQAEENVTIDNRCVRIGGMAKGSGMIHPDMATMISVITTDAVISPPALKTALLLAADKSFNRISIDGDTSVCDEVLIMASGLAQNSELMQGTANFDLFLDALTRVCARLSMMLASDGEGATKLLTIIVNGARAKEDAHKIASAIAKSLLCKTAAFGCDANWGRLLTAAGYSGAMFDPEKVDIFIGGVQVCKNGGALQFDERAALNELKKTEVIYTVDLNDGDASDLMWTCDLSFDYVKINASYRS